MAFYDFDAAAAEQVDQDEPITFRAGGRVWRVDRVSALQFGRFCRGVLAAIEASDQDHKDEKDELLADLRMCVAMADLVEGAVVDSQQADWLRVLDKTHPLVMVKIAHWLIQAATGRPTKTPSDSAVQPSQNGRSSNGVSDLSDPSTSPPAVSSLS